jgi:hypothetical protein
LLKSIPSQIGMAIAPEFSGSREIPDPRFGLPAGNKEMAHGRQKLSDNFPGTGFVGNRVNAFGGPGAREHL